MRFDINIYFFILLTFLDIILKKSLDDPRLVKICISFIYSWLNIVLCTAYLFTFSYVLVIFLRAWLLSYYSYYNSWYSNDIINVKIIYKLFLLFGTIYYFPISVDDYDGNLFIICIWIREITNVLLLYIKYTMYKDINLSVNTLYFFILFRTSIIFTLCLSISTYEYLSILLLFWIYSGIYTVSKINKIMGS